MEGVRAAGQLLAAADQQDGVAGGDGQHQHEPDQRAQRQHTAPGQAGDHAADQGRRQGQEDGRGRPPAGESGLHEEQDQHGGDGRDPEHTTLGGPLVGLVAEHLGVVLEWELHPGRGQPEGLGLDLDAGRGELRQHVHRHVAQLGGPEHQQGRASTTTTLRDRRLHPTIRPITARSPLCAEPRPTIASPATGGRRYFLS